MELSKTKNGFYIFSGTIILFIMVLGCWWLFLVFKLASQLENANLPSVSGNLITMVRWEGFTFFALVLTLGITVIYFFFQDHKKTKSLHAFFSSLTHELKTPLTSIKLQAEVLNEFTQDMDINHNDKERISRYTKRLTQDSVRLEAELEKHLQLSRLERAGKLNLASVDLTNFLKSEIQYFDDVKINIITDKNYFILADEFALKTIFSNLIQNSIRHNKNLKMIDITLNQIDNFITISYTDHGNSFKGEVKKLSSLFYKHDSPKGSGIGLYLIKTLTTRMDGAFNIFNDKSLVFQLRFKRDNTNV
jgi:signal transduction histidine kinase